MHSSFTPVDTLDAGTYLYSLSRFGGPLNRWIASGYEEVTQTWVMPVTGLENKGQPIAPPGFAKNYGLYLTIEATGIRQDNPVFDFYNTLKVSLWADPQNDAGTPHAAVNGGMTFPHNANDIVLATGTLQSATASFDHAAHARTATFVETMTPTLDGTRLLGGSIAEGSHLTETLSTPASAFQSLPSPASVIFDVINGGSAKITLDSGDILIPTASLQLSQAAGFLHQPHHHR
jgi:hypothetical protein